MEKEITMREFIDILQKSVNSNDLDKPLNGIGYSSDGFYTFHIDDGYVKRIIKIPAYKD